MAMNCPHCQHAIHEDKREHNFGQGLDADNIHSVEWARCPNCTRIIVWLIAQGGPRTLIHPGAVPPRPPAPAEVPADIAADYNEAGAVLPVSAKASAALSRRCLQRSATLDV
jgi:hypothetical protein